jgi:DNA-binding beta-propeller fold protein YncE
MQNTQIQVFNPVTLQWQNPLRLSANGGVGYSSMAMTPDGSKMMVLDSAANTLTVFDPDNPSQGVSTSVSPSTGATLYTVAATSTGKAFIGSFNGAALEFDLATNTYKTVNNSWLSLAKFVATPDGNYVLGVDES